MNNLSDRILQVVSKRNYQPVKAKVLAKKVGIPPDELTAFRKVLRQMVRDGQLELGKNRTVRKAQTHGTVIGLYRKSPRARIGTVRSEPNDKGMVVELRIRSHDALDAATGDKVQVQILRKPKHPGRKPTGKILRIIERATDQFVGTYFERQGEHYVRVDGEVFAHSIRVQNADVKQPKPDEKVVVEVIHFPTPEERGEGVIVEVLGPRGDPGVDTKSVMREFNLPDEFPEKVLDEARHVARTFRADDFSEREDFTQELTITIDPVNARDHDDAISVTVDPKSGHITLGVHIADVCHFVAPGSELDREAKKRATSVYLPQKVVPMFPEVLSNGLASLHENEPRYVKSVHIGYTMEGQRTDVQFNNGVIRVHKRFSYEQVMALYENPREAKKLLSPELAQMFQHMRDLAMILRNRRHERGSLELDLPETELELDDNGKVTGAHYRHHDLSHQIIEEFMLAANEAVAEKLIDLGANFLRRVHPSPEPKKLREVADFVKVLGYYVDGHLDRFSLQDILDQSREKPDAYAVHYALLRSLKQAVYSPVEEGHYALATETYCHFTSPIRRYPDLTVHRLIDKWIRSKTINGDYNELVALGEHCSLMEKRAERAERELIKIKLLEYLNARIGLELDGIITGVADYGFFAQSEKFPIEGRVHISTLDDDYYYYDETLHSLIGERFNRRYRLGDRVKVQVVRVDLQRRQLDFRVIASETSPPKKKKKKTKKRRR